MLLQCNIAAGPGRPKFWMLLRKSYIKALPEHEDLLLLHPSLSLTLLSINNPENSPTCLLFSPSSLRLLPLLLLLQLIQFLVSLSLQDQLLQPQRLDQTLLRSTLKLLATVELDVLKELLEASSQLTNQRMAIPDCYLPSNFVSNNLDIALLLSLMPTSLPLALEFPLRRTV